MSIAQAGGVPVDGDAFEFTPENRQAAERFMAKYPQGRQASAVISLLYLAQAQNGGWVSRQAMDHVASVLDMPAIRVYEVATFYTMFNLQPVGRHMVQVCTTTPCWLRGSDEVLRACRDVAGCEAGETSADGAFTVVEVECLGACANAPMLQINNEAYFEDLDYARTSALLAALREGRAVTPGSQIGRVSSEPEGGATTLAGFDPKPPPKQDLSPRPAEGAAGGAA